MLAFTIPWCGERRSEVIRPRARPAALVARGGVEALATLGETERQLDAFDTDWEGATTAEWRV